eukprot:m.211888 g.211888  ORF g.211888 m.211888 type:complete len:560 (+) comp15498_c0_seq8:112-1791(+)
MPEPPKTPAGAPTVKNAAPSQRGTTVSPGRKLVAGRGQGGPTKAGGARGSVGVRPKKVAGRDPGARNTDNTGKKSQPGDGARATKKAQGPGDPVSQSRRSNGARTPKRADGAATSTGKGKGKQAKKAGPGTVAGATRGGRKAPRGAIKVAKPADRAVRPTASEDAGTRGNSKRCGKADTAGKHASDPVSGTEASSESPEAAAQRLEAEAQQRAREQAEMDALEHEAWVIYIKAQQEEARRQAARAAEEKRRRQQQKQFERDLRDASFDGDLHTVQRLLEQQEVPISVNCKDANGEQAISEAASGGHPAVCALLLDYSADVNARGKYLRTPLYRAAFAGRVETVQFLLEEGADPRLTDVEGVTPAEAAAAVVRPTLAQWDVGETDRLADKVAARASEQLERVLAARQQQEGALQVKVADAQRRHDAKQRELRKAILECVGLRLPFPNFLRKPSRCSSVLVFSFAPNLVTKPSVRSRFGTRRQRERCQTLCCCQLTAWRASAAGTKSGSTSTTCAQTGRSGSRRTSLRSCSRRSRRAKHGSPNCARSPRPRRLRTRTPRPN